MPHFFHVPRFTGREVLLEGLESYHACFFGVKFCAPSWIVSYVQAVLTPDMWNFDVIPSIRAIPGIPAVTWLVLTCLNMFELFLSISIYFYVWLVPVWDDQLTAVIFFEVQTTRNCDEEGKFMQVSGRKRNGRGKKNTQMEHEHTLAIEIYTQIYTDIHTCTYVYIYIHMYVYIYIICVYT